MRRDPKEDARFWYELGEMLVKAILRTDNERHRRILRKADKIAVDEMLEAEDRAMQELGRDYD